MASSTAAWACGAAWSGQRPLLAVLLRAGPQGQTLCCCRRRCYRSFGGSGSALLAVCWSLLGLLGSAVLLLATGLLLPGNAGAVLCCRCKLQHSRARAQQGGMACQHYKVTASLVGVCSGAVNHAQGYARPGALAVCASSKKSPPPPANPVPLTRPLLVPARRLYTPAFSCCPA